MAIQLNEPIVTELVSRLRDDLAAAITAVNAAVTDGFTLESIPDDQIVAFVPPPELLTAYPSIGVGDGRSTFEDDEGFSATGRHEILIVIYQQNADQETLAWQLRRYTQAVIRVALDGRQLDSAAWGTGLSEVLPGPTLGDDPENPRTWMSWAGVRIWAKRDEE